MALLRPRCAALLLALAPAGVLAQPANAKASQPSTTDTTLGFGYHAQTRWTGSLTVMRGVPKMLVAMAPAKLAQVRVGPGGAQASAGLVFGVFEENPFHPSGIAVTLKATALRSFHSPRGVPSGLTYAGVETDVVVLGIRGSFGYLRRVSGPRGPGGSFLWSIGLGL